MDLYDSDVLRAMAKRLYRKANSMVAICAVLGFAVGYLLAEILFSRPTFKSSEVLTGILCGIVGGFLGWARGDELRFKAQIILCIAQIEKNTRGYR
jgi:uncharacterized membrane protein